MKNLLLFCESKGFQRYSYNSKLYFKSIGWGVFEGKLNVECESKGSRESTESKLNVECESKGSRESTESKLNVECESKGSRESTESKPTTVENIEFPADAFHMVTQVLFFFFSLSSELLKSKC